MANYQNLKAEISAAIRTNGNQEITGQVLQDVLNSIVSVIGANYTFAGVATPATNPGTPDQNVMYLAMEGGTYTNFNGTVLPAGISLLMWNGTWMSETVMYGDGGVFDISVYKSSGGTLATFADLTAALGTNGANIPEPMRKGGMTVKFVQSSDNKYVQYRLMSDTFNTTPTNWQGVDSEPVADSKNLVESGGVADKFFDLDLFLDKVLINYNIDSQGKVQYTSSFKSSFVVKVTGKSVLRIAKGSRNGYFSFLKSLNFVIGQTADFCSGESGRRTVETSNAVSISIPQDCNYICCLLTTDGTMDFTPSVFSVDGVSFLDQIVNIKYYINKKADEVVDSVSLNDRTDDEDKADTLLVSMERSIDGGDNEVIDTLPLNSATTEKAGLMSALDKVNTNNSVTQLSLLTELVQEDNIIKISNIPNIISLEGYNCGAPINNPGIPSSVFSTSALSGYSSFYFIADYEMDIYADNYTGNYFSIVIGKSLSQIVERTGGALEFQCSKIGSERYRASDSNLPTAQNKLHVEVGDVIVFTLKSGNDADVHGFTMTSYFAVKKEYTKSCGYVKYIGTSGIQSSIARLEVLVPTGSGYTKYLLVHTVNENLNADVWRLGHAYATDRMFNEIIQLTIDGEWEVAVKLTGRSDFSGGYAHGDQVIQSAVFMLDGGAIDITTLTDYTPFVQFTVVENSYLYDPDEGSKLSDDESTKVKIAEHVSEHIFTIDGVKINQYLKWLIDATNVLDRAYLAMLPISKSTSNKLYTNKDYIAGDIAYGQIHGASRAVTYSSNKGAMFDFSVQDYPLGYLLITDNGGYAYHKEYFSVDDGLSNRPVGTIWKSTTLYKINYNV